MTVATALAVSWKPFTNSKPNVRTRATSRMAKATVPSEPSDSNSMELTSARLRAGLPGSSARPAHRIPPECRRPSAPAAVAPASRACRRAARGRSASVAAPRRCQATRCVAALTATGGRGASTRSRSTDQKKRSPMKGCGSRLRAGHRRKAGPPCAAPWPARRAPGARSATGRPSSTATPADAAAGRP